MQTVETRGDATGGRPRWRSRGWLVAAIALVVLACVVSAIGVDSPATSAIIIGSSLVIAAAIIAWTLLRVGAQRRRFEDELARWAAQQAAGDERLRIAAELHDLVSHGLGTITVRAAAARLSEQGAEHTAALADIERVGRATTTELRRMLTVLRDPHGAPLTPTATLDDLPGIVDAARATGLEVTMTQGDLGDVSAGVQVTACAIVREALANTLRHAGPTSAAVQLGRRGDTVEIRVTDSGAVRDWHAHPGAGHGLDGLRERVTALDGTVHAGPGTHGFEVVARLPDPAPTTGDVA